MAPPRLAARCPACSRKASPTTKSWSSTTARPMIPRRCWQPTAIESASSRRPIAGFRQHAIPASARRAASTSRSSTMTTNGCRRCSSDASPSSIRMRIAALVYAGALKVDLTGSQMPDQSSENEDTDSPTMEQMLARPWVVVPSRVMVRRAILERCGGFEERCVTACEDVFFLLRARECGYFRRVPELLVRKTTRPLYPKALKREQACELLVRLVRERYGASAEGFIREYRRSRVKVMKHIGSHADAGGAPRPTRADAWPASFTINRRRPRLTRRYLKTFLPVRAPRTSSSTENPATPD